MADRDVDLTKDQEVQEYLDNLGTEYRFGCYSEKNPKGKLQHVFYSSCLISWKIFISACQLLGEFMEAINRDFEKAFKIFESNCLTHSFGPSCNKAGFYLVSGHYTGEADPVSDKRLFYLMKTRFMKEQSKILLFTSELVKIMNFCDFLANFSENKPEYVRPNREMQNFPL